MAAAKSNVMQGERVEMEQCVYCGNAIPKQAPQVRVKQRSFDVCSDTCKSAAEAYLARDKKFKTVLYLVILVAAIIILFTAVTGGNMLPVNIAQIVVGFAFLLFPYPVSAFTTFQNCPIKTVVHVTRAIGIGLAAFGVVLVAAAIGIF